MKQNIRHQQITINQLKNRSQSHESLPRKIVVLKKFKNNQLDEDHKEYGLSPEKREKMKFLRNQIQINKTKGAEQDLTPIKQTHDNNDPYASNLQQFEVFQSQDIVQNTKDLQCQDTSPALNSKNLKMSINSEYKKQYLQKNNNYRKYFIPKLYQKDHDSLRKISVEDSKIYKNSLYRDSYTSQENLLPVLKLQQNNQKQPQPFFGSSQYASNYINWESYLPKKVAKNHDFIINGLQFNGQSVYKSHSQKYIEKKAQFPDYDKNQEFKIKYGRQNTQTIPDLYKQEKLLSQYQQSYQEQKVKDCQEIPGQYRKRAATYDIK